MSKQLIHILKNTAGVSDTDIEDAERLMAEKGGSLGEVLLKREVITESQLLEAMGIQYDLPFWPRLPMEPLPSDLTQQVPIHFLKKHFMVPLASNGGNGGNGLGVAGRIGPGASGVAGADASDGPGPLGGFIIAINDPMRFQALDDLIRIMGALNYQVVLSTREAILSAINLSYDLNRDSAEQLVQDMEENGATIISEIEGASDLLDDTSDAPIIKLVNHIISQSVKARASDIHIEPYQDSFKVRYRVDGILYDLLTPPKWIQPALTSRIKVMSKMNIAEKRLPQDGRMEVKLGDQDIDVRISTIPTTFGERVVLRLLNKSSSLLTLTELGITRAQLDLMAELVKSPNGIILVTGPTGSGKTTTLYAILSSINKPDINIITIEDPVEYQLRGISQIQVNPKINLTFARGLRSIVRQDPDVVLVGEIRDRETAEIAVQSALTGHLVFSTLHTNDSASAITRLVDIGVEPFLISSSVIAVAAQRLVRTLCNECRQPYMPDELALQTIGITPRQAKDGNIYQAVGCPNCLNTGYRGRCAIIEIMVMDGNLKSIILQTYDSNRIKAAAKMTSLRQDGILKILSGMTTLEEVLRVTQR